MDPDFGEADDAADVVAVGVGDDEGRRLVGELGDGLVEVGHPGAGVDDEGAVFSFDDIDGFVVAEVAVAFPGVFVDLAEDDVGVTVHEFLRIVAAVVLGLGGVPDHDGVAVAEVGVEQRVAEVGRLALGGAGLDLVEQGLHVVEVADAEFAALGEIEPVFLPVVAAVDPEAAEVGLEEAEGFDEVGDGGDVLREAVFVEDPHAVAGADGVAGEEQVVVLQVEGDGARRMAGNGDGHHQQAAEVKGVAFVDESALRFGETVREIVEVLLRQGEADVRVVGEGGDHPGVVAVVVGEGDGDGLAGGTLEDDVAERLGGVIRPVDGVGQVDDQGFFLSDEEVDVGAVVEMGLVALRVEALSGGVGFVVVLDVPDIVFYDGDGVGTDFDIFGLAAGRDRKGQREG